MTPKQRGELILKQRLRRVRLAAVQAILTRFWEEARSPQSAGPLNGLTPLPPTIQ